jgi:hypothetical protein
LADAERIQPLIGIQIALAGPRIPVSTELIIAIGIAWPASAPSSPGHD